MAEKIFDQHASDDIILHIGDFDGPIELLVHLARSKGLDIFTLKISQIIDQYMEYVAQIRDMDLDCASEFLLMASILLEIKAKALLPIEEEVVVDTDEQNAEEEIIKLMIEYQLFQDKAIDIKKSETLNRFYREPEYDEKDARISIRDFNLDKLMQAYAKVLFKFTKEEEIIDVKKIERDIFTVARQLNLLVHELKNKKRISFFDIFDEMSSKNEVINTFLALLQLVGKQFAKINQNEIFGDIDILINEELEIDVFNNDILAMIGEEDDFDGQSNTNS